MAKTQRSTHNVLVTEAVGRKWALEINVFVFVIGAILMTVASYQLSFICKYDIDRGLILVTLILEDSGRVLTGLACGGITATVPSYIAELAVPSIRGILTGLFEAAYQVGSVIGFWINYGITQHISSTSSTSWRIPMAFQLVPSGMLLIGGFFLHESPLWLMRKHKDEQAYTVLEDLRKLHRDDPYIQEEVAMIRSRLSEEDEIARRFGTGSWVFARGAGTELSRKGMRIRVFLVFCSFALQNLSGAAAINYYSPILFGSLGISDVALYAGIYGLVKAISSLIFYMLLIDLLGRRRPVIVSSVACSLCLWVVGTYVKIGRPAEFIAAGQPLSASTAEGGQAAIAMIMIYSVFWSFGLNGVPWIVAAEIFPGALRNLSGTFAATVQW